MTTLLESKAKPYGSRKGALVSMVLHGALIGGAVYASGKAVLPEREELEEHSILFVAPPPPKVHVAPDPVPEPKKPPPAAKEPRAPQQPRVRAPRPPQAPAPRPQPAAQTVIAPTTVPVSLPPVNLKAAPTVDVDIRVAPPEIPTTSASRGSLVRSSAGGDVEGRSGGTRGGLGSGASNKAYSENQVERAVVATRPAQPRYPDALKSVSIQGEVIAQYIVDQRGRVEPGSIKILSATHRLFAESVRRALLDARYRPAQVGGQNVRQLVEQPFIFKLED